MSETTTKPKTCFCIAPIGQDGSEERKRSDQVLRYVIKEALEPKGYTVTRADEIASPGSITTQVIESIWKSDIVVADLTDHNPNVFYELAVRHAVQRPIIHMIQENQRIPFDVADFRTIHVELSLDGAAKARKELCAHVEEVERGATCVTPVSLAGLMIELGKSSSDDKVVLRQLLEGLGEMRAETRNQFAEMVTQIRDISTRYTTVPMIGRKVLETTDGKKKAVWITGTPETPPSLGEPKPLRASDAVRAILARKQAEMVRRAEPSHPNAPDNGGEPPTRQG